MNKILMCISLFFITALVTGTENSVSQILSICGVVIDDPYPIKRMSLPVANARVELRSQVYTIQSTTDVYPLPIGTLIDSEISGSDGKFCFKNEPAGSYYVIITQPDYRTRQLYFSASVDTVMSIALLYKDAVSSVSGTVSAVCLNGGGICVPKAVPGCSVSVSLNSYVLAGLAPVTGEIFNTITDALGNYIINDIPLSYNGEKVNFSAIKSGTTRIASATLLNTATETVNFDNFPSDFSGDTSFHVSPSKPTSKDSIQFRFYNPNDNCCAIYRDTNISIIDSTIYIKYSVDNSKPCPCPSISGRWANFKSKPINSGRYYVYKSYTYYCQPGMLCAYPVPAPVFLGSLIVNNPTGVNSPVKRIKTQDAVTLTLTGSSVIVNLANGSLITLKAYSINGALLGELYNGFLPAGSHNIKTNDLGRMSPANSMIILKMDLNGVTKAVQKVTAGNYIK